MKVTLKKLKIYDRLSEETTAFNADVYVDGKLIAHAENTGKGGNTWITPAKPELRQEIEELEAWAKTRPPIPSEYSPEGLPMSLDFYIDLLVTTYATAKDKRNKAQGFLLLENIGVQDESGVDYPEFCLWRFENGTFKPQSTIS